MSSRILAATLLTGFVASMAHAQGYGPPNQPPIAQPGPPGSLLVGSWAGTATGTSGTVEVADQFNADGTFTSVARLTNGFVARVWGTYRVSPAGPNQFRLELQYQRWLPTETCQQMQGGQPQCRPVPPFPAGVSTLSFPNPNQVQSASQTEPGSYSVEHREDQPVLLLVQAPQRWITITQASPGGGGGTPYVPVSPYVSPYVTPGRRGPATNIPGLGGNCDDLQQQRICNINDGYLYRGRDGCMHCSR